MGNVILIPLLPLTGQMECQHMVAKKKTVPSYPWTYCHIICLCFQYLDKIHFPAPVICPLFFHDGKILFQVRSLGLFTDKT